MAHTVVDTEQVDVGIERLLACRSRQSHTQGNADGAFLTLWLTTIGVILTVALGGLAVEVESAHDAVDDHGVDTQGLTFQRSPEVSPGIVLVAGVLGIGRVLIVATLGLDAEEVAGHGELQFAVVALVLDTVLARAGVAVVHVQFTIDLHTHGPDVDLTATEVISRVREILLLDVDSGFEAQAGGGTDDGVIVFDDKADTTRYIDIDGVGICDTSEAVIIDTEGERTDLLVERCHRPVTAVEVTGRLFRTELEGLVLDICLGVHLIILMGLVVVACGLTHGFAIDPLLAALTVGESHLREVDAGQTDIEGQRILLQEFLCLLVHLLVADGDLTGHAELHLSVVALPLALVDGFEQEVGLLVLQFERGEEEVEVKLTVEGVLAVLGGLDLQEEVEGS